MPGLSRKGKGSSHASLLQKLRWQLLSSSLFIICYQLAQLVKNMGNLSNYTYSFANDSFENNLPIMKKSEEEKEEDNSIHFWEKSKSCFHLNNICHHGKNDSWFYDVVGNFNNGHDANKYQPTISYMKDRRYGARWPDYSVYFNVTSYHDGLREEEGCSYSPQPYHVVAQTSYNEMMGEFYKRFLRPMHQLLKDYPLKNAKDLHLYLDFFTRGKQNIFDGHHLFLNGLPQTFEVDTFLSLVQDDSSCQCFKTLAFCGYILRNITNPEVAENTTHSFIPTSGIQSNTSTWAELRQDLLATYAKKDPMLTQKIRQYKQQILRQRGVREEEMNNVDEWKIIGLTDRKSRRVWLNIDDNIKACDKYLEHKILCTKLNVEKGDNASPEEHLLMHASLNAMIGVHGSQFTNGIFLPAHSFIVELLPWMKYHELDADWVASTGRPTPMGEIFHESNLNSFGYCLGRESVPLCEHVDKEDEHLDKACLNNRTSGVKQRFEWDVRDFNVDVGIIEKFMSAFLLQKNGTNNCDEMKKRGRDNGFILYNAFCSHADDATGIATFGAKHYYTRAMHCPALLAKGFP